MISPQILYRVMGWKLCKFQQNEKAMGMGGRQNCRYKNIRPVFGDVFSKMIHILVCLLSIYFVSQIFTRYFILAIWWNGQIYFIKINMKQNFCLPKFLWFWNWFG